VAIGVLTALLVAVGCGSNTSTQSSKSAVVAAAAKTKQQGSARFAIKTAAQMGAQSGAGQSFTVTGRGLFDYKNRRGGMTLNLPAMPGATGGRSPTQIVFQGLVLYMKSPLFSRLMPGADKPWVKFDLREMGQSLGANMSQLAQLGQNDPTQSLEYLKAAGHVKEEGKQTIRGVQTTHYHAVISLEKVASEAPKQVAASVKQLIAVSGTKTVPADVWIDDKGLLRRMHYAYAISGQTLGKSKVALTMDLFDFGVSVNVKPPPQGEVTDLTKLMQHAAAGMAAASPTS
jgi:hypothetical protein